ncbi:MAG: hypothetical protein LBQ60_14660 [Bacteroidales bacterium]|jgi:hypothetical protein|nr:hypothetical protein [Bacteroidales bacterium]
MGRKKIFIFVVISFLCLPGAFGKKKNPVDFWPVEETILRLFGEIRNTMDDSLAIQKHLQIEEILAQTLTMPAAYKHKFDSLRLVGRLYAPRKKFLLFNWHHSFRDGSYRHFALIVIPGKKEPSRVIRLTDLSDSIKRPENQTLGANEWLGTLYYKIIPKKKAKDKKKYYTLLGLDMNNLDTKKKMIEVMTFDENGNPWFGAPIIELNGWTKYRVVFEFSSAQSMYLEYNRRKRRIEFDHLAPLMPYLVGEYEYYEPDMYRDALKFKKGHWKHHKDIQEPPKDKKLKKSSLPKPPRFIRLPKPEKEDQEKDTDEEPEEEILPTE